MILGYHATFLFCLFKQNICLFFVKSVHPSELFHRAAGWWQCFCSHILQMLNFHWTLYSVAFVAKGRQAETIGTFNPKSLSFYNPNGITGEPIQLFPNLAYKFNGRQLVVAMLKVCNEHFNFNKTAFVFRPFGEEDIGSRLNNLRTFPTWFQDNHYPTSEDVKVIPLLSNMLNFTWVFPPPTITWNFCCVHGVCVCVCASKQSAGFSCTSWP